MHEMSIERGHRDQDQWFVIHSHPMPHKPTLGIDPKRSERVTDSLIFEEASNERKCFNESTCLHWHDFVFERLQSFCGLYSASLALWNEAILCEVCKIVTRDQLSRKQ